MPLTFEHPCFAKLVHFECAHASGSDTITTPSLSQSIHIPLRYKHTGEDYRAAMDHREEEMKALRNEAISLRRSGADAAAAYERSKKRCDELMESLVELQARYDAAVEASVAATTSQTANEPIFGSMSQSKGSSFDVYARMVELERALAAKDDILRGMQAANVKEATETCVSVNEEMVDEGQAIDPEEYQDAVRPVDEPLEGEAMRDFQPSSFGAQKADSKTTGTDDPPIDYTPPGAEESVIERGTQMGGGLSICTPEKQVLKGTIQSLLYDLTFLKDFAGAELKISNEAFQAIQEEGAQKEKMHADEVRSLKAELAQTQAMLASLRAEAQERASRDNLTIQELEVTVQLTEGALRVAKQQEEAAVAAAAAATAECVVSLPEGATSPAATSKLLGLVESLRYQLQKTQERADEAEDRRGHLIQEMSELEDRLARAEQELATTAAGALRGWMEGPLSAPEDLDPASLESKGRHHSSEDRSRAMDRSETEAAAPCAPPAPSPLSSSSTATAKYPPALRRVQAELLQTKTQLDTAKTNTSLLQRYIVSRRMQTWDGVQKLLEPTESQSTSHACVTASPQVASGRIEGHIGGTPVLPAAGVPRSSPPPLLLPGKTEVKSFPSPPAGVPARISVAHEAEAVGKSGAPASVASSSLFSLDAAIKFFSFSSPSSATSSSLPGAEKVSGSRFLTRVGCEGVDCG